MNFTRFDPSALEPREASRRRNRMIALVALLMVPPVLAMADLHGRSGFDGWKVLHLALFTILFGLVALGAAQALVGFFVRRQGKDPCRIEASLTEADHERVLHARTAVVMPICNEDVARVIEGLRVMYESVEKTGKLTHCDFFLLSDSTDPNRWIEEEAMWLALTQELGAHGRIFYRKRRVGINKKAGNLADFCRRWARHYRYMVVLDADSVVTGEAIVSLVRLMEKNQQVGIIQGVPQLVNGETILARLQQFASRLYGAVSTVGLNYWQLSEANYWGHNAIIRLAPFIRHCSLPELPGDGPFGGRILSHDYVEAALMRRAGWQVWLATELSGNYEEGPANLVDLAGRDRRWLQGNLQHTRLIVARGFHGVNRLHFILGIFSYLASPLWLAFLVVSTIVAHRLRVEGVPIAGSALETDYGWWSHQTQALCLFGFTLLLLFVPKILSLIDLRQRPDEVARFGGWRKLLAGVGLETALFTLIAPVLMLFHTKFIVMTLCRQKVGWGAQRRGRAGQSVWGETVMAHGTQTLLGVAAAVWVFQIDPLLAAWMSPILAGLIFSIPISYLTGSLPAGESVRARGWLQTPEETQPVPELARLEKLLVARQQRGRPLPELAGNYGLLQAVLDPYINAVHLSLLRTKDDQPSPSEESFAALRETLLAKGPDALTPRDRMALLMDPHSMVVLHDELWSSPTERLAEWWRLSLRHYTCLAPAPQTAFSR
ncbi:MAG TPA: glucans biosynthesis glucosyltransferase MdoH [Opitutaceae bacterium]|nr:glucans biosynthesis glucosyltransferase MdoH [Opitutaceae bacterium]